MIELRMSQDDIAEIRFDAPGEKVNILTEAALAKLAEVLTALESACRDGQARAAVLTSAKKGVFLAGADVKAFVTVAAAGDAAAAAEKARAGQVIFTRLASLPIPTVAALNGVCLGGGLELALACTARVASDGPEVTLGLPEVRLGLIPGWGGTQRLPRLIGVSRALDLILTGRSLNAKAAMRLGLVDAVAPKEGIDHAARHEASRLATGARISRPRWAWIDRLPLGRAIVLAAARRRALALSAGHYPAPPAAIEAVKVGLRHGIEAGLRLEAETVGRLLVGEVSRNLVSIFFATRSTSAAGAGGGIARQQAAPIRSIGVLGAGTMGGGIAAVAALTAGLPVRLRDVDAPALARGMGQVRALAAEIRRKRRLPESDLWRREALVGATVDPSGFSRCDLVIEAVVEDLAVKQQVLRETEAVAPHALFATNTSSLSVAAIAEAASRPGRVLGLHFFNPVARMPLVEVVRAPGTDDDAVEAAVALARRMGKTPVVVKDTPGFIVNRILMPYLGEAINMLERSGDAGTVTAVDQAMVRFGMPMGPFALLDQIGLDVAARVAGVLKAAFPEKPWDSRLLQAMTQAGLLGAKSGRGFYVHGSRGGPKISPELARLLAATYRPPAGEDARAERAASSGSRIEEILIDVMIQEAATLLEEGAVDRPEVIDLALILGAGFPPFRGGLLRHADALGTGARDAVAGRLRERGIQPAPALARPGRFYS